jgi:uncharacterized protein (TIGR02453 family)
MAAPSTSFPADTLRFLGELKAHNDKSWFDANKARYEAIRQAGLAFVEEAAVALPSVSRHVAADPKPVGGSMMRIYRDVRFSKDKTPYKTHLAFGFHHRQIGEGKAAPGYYLHVEPGDSQLCAGVWRPSTADAGKIRSAIAQDGKGWTKAKGKLAFMGESLARVPKGFDPDSLHADDLRRKDFVACVLLADRQVTGPRLMQGFVAACKATAPLNAFLADALDVPW